MLWHIVVVKETRQWVRHAQHRELADLLTRKGPLHTEHLLHVVDFGLFVVGGGVGRSITSRDEVILVAGAALSSKACRGVIFIGVRLFVW